MMDDFDKKATVRFNSLAEIEAYKEQVRHDLRKDEERIAFLWKDLFHKEESHGPKTPVQRVMGMVNMGSGVIDGLILGWKLYRKFNGARPWWRSGRHR